jgi:beta-galactosidase GanA
MLSLHAHDPVPPLVGHLPMGTAPDDPRPVRVDSRAVRRDGRPWLPVMGEFHFSRFPESRWRHELLLMRAGGIDVVATYLFWNHHEEVRGRHRFDGNRDVRRFVELCAGLDLAVAVRIGPWSHGECRNGGFPDWLADRLCWFDLFYKTMQFNQLHGISKCIDLSVFTPSAIYSIQ